VTDLPPERAPHLTPALAAAVDVEGKVARALVALGPIAGRDAALVDWPGAPALPLVQAAGGEPLVVALASPLAIPAADASLDLVLTLWAGFQGVDAADLVEVDRVLRPGGRLLVVHDYGRDDVSLLRDPDAPEYRLWSKRDGPFLRGGGFRIRVVHCFWTFPDLDVARTALEELYGARGTAIADRLKRPRLSWNVAVYHRWRGGVTAPPADGTGPAGDTGSGTGASG
jgi:SAM-dependent methyltransferase